MGFHRFQGPARALLSLAALLCAAAPAPADGAGLTIDQALQLAQSASEAVRIKDLAVRKARLAQREAEARAWPHVDLQASGSYLVNPPTGYTVKAGSLGAIVIPALGVNTPMPTSDFSIGAQPYDYFSVAATLSQPLFTWGKIRAAIDAAALQVQSAGTDLVAQRRDIEREVHRAYFGALLAQESAKVLAALSETAAQIVADRQAALDAGTGTRESVLEAKSRKAQVDSRLVEAEQSGATARESLGMLTGLDPSGIVLATGFRDAVPALDEAALRARAEDVSTDVAGSRIRQGQAQKKLALEQGGALLRPDLALGLSFAATGAQNYLVLNGAPPNSSASTSWTWDLVISLSVKMSVFDGSESASRIGEAQQDLEAAGHALAQSRKLARLAVRRSVEAARAADADLAERLAAEDYAAEREKNAQAAFDGGMANRADLRTAQILLGSARLDRLLAQYTREEALADIARLTGERPVNLTELSVRRPTAILMGVLLILGLGVVGYVNLGADLFPAVNTPIISVTSSYAGAGAEEIDKEVIKPIEDAVSGINGIETIRSTSGTGFGYTIVQFTMTTDMNAAVIDVQKALDGAAGGLPRDATRPVIQKFDLNSQPFLIASVTGSGTPEELSNLAERVRDDLESLPGVGNVSVLGSRKKQLEITLDRTALQYYGVSPSTLLGAVKAQNLDIPAGDLKQTARELPVRLVGEFSGVDDVKNLLVPTAAGGSVRLSELAQVKLDYPDPSIGTRLNARPTIGIFVRKQSDANVVTTADAVKKELAALGPTLPAGASVTIASDATLFINSSLAETRLNLLESILTTSLVLFLFLRSWRSSAIVLVAIPVSLVGTFFAMWAFHFTLNIVSLMALGLCIGILVDDSIVILENIDRHIGLGESPREAAVSGRREIALAAIAITLCDVVVFAPIAFMTDIVGQFFREFGLTVVSATLLSLLVSFTVTPMMASRMLRRAGGRAEGAPGLPEAPGAEEPRGPFGRFFEKRVKGTYRRFLVWSLDHRAAVIVPVAVLVAAAIALIPLKVVGTEFMPTADQNKLIVDLDLGAGAGYAQTDAKVKVVEAHLLGLPEVEDEFAIIGSSTTRSTAEIVVKLKDKARRRASQAEVARALRAWGRGLPGVAFSVTEPGVISRTSIEGTKPLIVNVTGPSRDVLRQLAGRVEEVVRSIPGAADVDNTMRAAQNELAVHVDRLAASSYGLAASDIALVLRTALAGTNAGVYRHAGDEYDMMVSYRQDQLRRPEDLGALKMTNPAGQQISLSQVARFERTDSAREVLRRDRQNVATISANTAGRPLGALTADIKARMAGVRIPQGYEVSYTGDQANMASSFRSLSWALAASLVLVFMILVVLYESFLTPIIRMLSIPCGVIGALGALAVTGKAIGIISFIGLIMLDGLISKNGTLLIDYTHTLTRRGMSLREALVQAGITRLRPILMTSVTMIVGMLPLALSLGASSEIRSGMAVVLIGGLVTSTILTPILLPVVYTMIEEARSSRARRRQLPASDHGGYAS